MVVLVALVLINIGLIFYIKKEIESFKRHFKMTYEGLTIDINKLHTDVYKFNGEILKKLEVQSNQIKNIPKDITIKNILSLP